jgi:NADPH2:quinone reductase
VRAVVCNAWGFVENLVMEDVPAPAPAPGEVLFEVKAAGVNFADSILVAGNYQTKPELPFSPGLEGAGVIAAVGDGVSRFKPGDRVMALLAYGGFAEQAVTPETDAFSMPDGMSFEEGGAFPVSYISSDVAIRWQARLTAGETMLVLGAAGGVGLTAVEIGKAMGARVIAGASSSEKLAAAASRGADEGINYSTEDLKERVMALTKDRGVDVVYDPVGGDLFDPAFSSTGWGGRYLVIGFAGGLQKISANRILVKHRAVLGSSLRYFRWYAPEKLETSAAALIDWFKAGQLKPLVTQILPLEKTIDAIKLLADRKAHGKIVIMP